LASYGSDAFIRHFYLHLGTAYMQPYEAGLRSFLRSIREDGLGSILQRMDDARSVFNKERAVGQRIRE
jgi:hypothetical protein